MFLFKRKNGYYYLYFDEGGKQKKVSTKTKSKSEALKFVSQLKNQSKLQDQNLISKRLKELKQQYISYSKTYHKSNTTKAIELTFRFFDEYIGNPFVKDITTAKLNEYFQYRISNHSIYQARKDLINLRRFFQKLEEDGNILINPCRKIKGIRIPEKSPVFFSKVEFNRLMEIVKEEDLIDLYIFAVNTGLRLNEIRYLKRDNIESNNVFLHNHSKLTKNSKVRSVPLNQTAYKIVLKRISQNKNYLFTYRGFQLGERTATQKLKQYTTELGLNSKLNFHSFRHTFASWLVQSGVSIYNISKLLGHSDVKVTEKYSHLRTEDLTDSVNML